MKKLLFFVILPLLLMSCNTTTTNIVIPLKEFGPSSYSEDLLGYAFWQWNNHGDSRPREYDINIVVYRNTTLEKVSKQYPVIEAKEQDYRYISYDEIMPYLNQTIKEFSAIKENVFPLYTEQLTETKKKIIDALGE
jgi:hypothetical protein